MKMLVEQAEANISRALIDADKPEAVESGEFPDEQHHEDGRITTLPSTYYSCGSCFGYDEDEVRSEYKHLIVQLTRRSVFLTIFGLFEHRMVDCLALMDDLSSKTTDKTRKTIEDCHKRLKRNFGGKSIKDVDHWLLSETSWLIAMVLQKIIRLFPVKKQKKLNMKNLSCVLFLVRWLRTPVCQLTCLMTYLWMIGF